MRMCFQTLNALDLDLVHPRCKVQNSEIIGYKTYIKREMHDADAILP